MNFGFSTVSRAHRSIISMMTDDFYLSQGFSSRKIKKKKNPIMKFCVVCRPKISFLFRVAVTREFIQ